MSYPKIERNFLKLSGFTQMLKEKGIQPSNKVLKANEIEPNKKISGCSEYNLEPKCFFIERLRYGNNVPIALEYTYIPSERFPGLLKHEFV